MSNNCPVLMRRLRAAACAAIFLSMSWLHTETASAQSAVAPILPNTARIWFYREYEPYVSRNYATVMLNGAVAGSVQPYGGVIYRDVPPGYYHLTVESFGQDVNQDAAVDLAPGQEAYVKILNLPSWESGGAFSSYSRDTYYLRLVPAPIARAEIARRPF